MYTFLLLKNLVQSPYISEKNFKGFTITTSVSKSGGSVTHRMLNNLQKDKKWKKPLSSWHLLQTTYFLFQKTWTKSQQFPQKLRSKEIFKHLQMKMTYFADQMKTQDYMKIKRETKRQINTIFRCSIDLFILHYLLLYSKIF